MVSWFEPRTTARVVGGPVPGSRSSAEEAALEFWQIVTIGTQAIVAAATVGVLWLAARKDSRDARTEFQQAVETLMAGKLEAMDGRITGKLEAMDVKIDSRLEAMDGKIDSRLEAMDGKIDSIRTENADIKVRLNAIEEHLRQRRAR